MIKGSFVEVKKEWLEDACDLAIASEEDLRLRRRAAAVRDYIHRYNMRIRGSWWNSLMRALGFQYFQERGLNSEGNDLEFVRQEVCDLREYNRKSELPDFRWYDELEAFIDADEHESERTTLAKNLKKTIQSGTLTYYLSVEDYNLLKLSVEDYNLLKFY